jgi:hypothetical protein
VARGFMMHSTDGATCHPQSSGTKNNLFLVYGTGDGKTLWVVGGHGTIEKAAQAGRYPVSIEHASDKRSRSYRNSSCKRSAMVLTWGRLSSRFLAETSLVSSATGKGTVAESPDHVIAVVRIYERGRFRSD